MTLADLYETLLADHIEQDMKEAADAIEESGLPEMANHLREFVVRTGNSFAYVGDKEWKL